MKMIVMFSLKDRLKHIGHLDLMRAMQRALRRSGLPVCYSQGFNPHILLSFAAPLSVGMEGEREVMEVPLSEDVAPDTFIARLNDALPPLVRCLSARQVADDHPAAMAQLGAAQFEITPLESADALLAAVPGFLAQESIPAMRKSKKGMVPVDLRPLIYNLRVKDGHLEALLALHPSGTCKPDLMMQALSSFAGLPTPAPYDIRRTALLTERFSPLEEA